MSIIGQNILAGASGGGAYTIDQSLRINDGDSAYLSRTQTGWWDRKTWTFSCWFKRSNIGSIGEIFGCTASPGDAIRFPTANTLEIMIDGGTYQLVTSQVFRDPSAWYHLVVVLDTTQSTDTDRLKFYVNGDLVTSYSTTNYPTEDYEPGGINTSGLVVSIGKALSTQYYDGYLAEVYFIDGQPLTLHPISEKPMP